MAKNDPRPEITIRAISIHWWNSLTSIDKLLKSEKYFADTGFFERNFNTLTGREIEEIWKMELKEMKIIEIKQKD